MSRVSSALFLRSSAETPWISNPKEMLSSTVRFGRSPKCWKTIPIFLRLDLPELLGRHLEMWSLSR